MEFRIYEGGIHGTKKHMYIIHSQGHNLHTEWEPELKNEMVGRRETLDLI